jgi:hypothetical protein
MTPFSVRALWVARLPHQHRGLDLEHLGAVGELDQAGRAGEESGAEVGEDAEAEDVDLQLVDDLGELVDLGGRVELRLVTDQVVDPGALGEGLDREPPEVEDLVYLLRVGAEAQAGGDDRDAGPVVRGEEPADPAAGGVVVVGLEGQGRLPRVHRPGAEGQLGHPRILSSPLLWGCVGAGSVKFW